MMRVWTHLSDTPTTDDGPLLPIPHGFFVESCFHRKYCRFTATRTVPESAMEILYRSLLLREPQQLLSDSLDKRGRGVTRLEVLR